MAGQLGRVQIGGSDCGAAFAVGPRLVVTANHVVREHADTPVVYVPSGGEPVAVERLQHDLAHDAAILWLVSDVGEYLPAAAAQRGAEWRIQTPPPGANDPELHGTVSSVRLEIHNAKSHRVDVVQLHVNEDLGDFGGYSGSAVLDSSGRVVLGLLVEQKLLRTGGGLGGKKAATNVLYAVPIGDLITVFDLPVQVHPLQTDRHLANLVDIADDSDLPVVSTLDPYQLGATASLVGDSTSYGVADGYVARTAGSVDERLGAALRAGLEGGPMVMVFGPSKAGKTRTAFEALRSLLPQARLAAPKPGMLTALAAHPRWQNSTDPIVVWLDDLNRFITHADQLTPSVLTALRQRPGPVVVVATMRSEERERLRDDGELMRPVRMLFEQANEIALRPTSDDRDEAAAARAAYPNVRHNAGLGAELAGAPVLLEQYDAAQHADPIRRGVVEVVIDWARAGRPDPIPEPVLTRLAHELMFDRWPHLDVDDADISVAIRKARTPPPGSGPVAMLDTKKLPDRIRGYRPFDYLVSADDGQNHPDRPIPEWFWDSAIHDATPDVLFGVGTAAYQRGHHEEGVRVLHLAAEGGQIDAMYNLGMLELHDGAPKLSAASDGMLALSDGAPKPVVAGQISESTRRWLESAAAGGHPEAMYVLGALEIGDLPAVRKWWEKAAASGHAAAMLHLADLLADCDAPDVPAARHWYKQAAAVGITEAMNNLGVLLTKKVDPPDLPAARRWFKKAAAAGSPGAMRNLGVLLSEHWQPPDLPAARAWLEKAAAAGETGAMTNLGDLLANRWQPPDLPAARAWFQKAAAAGDIRAMYGLGGLLADRWDPPDLPAARRWYKKAAAAGDTDAMNNLGVLLASRVDRRDLKGARAWWEKAAITGHANAMNNLGKLFAELWYPPDLRAARSWYEQAAAAGHTEAMYSLGVLLGYYCDPPDRRTARVWAMRAAAAGNVQALVLLAKLNE